MSTTSVRAAPDFSTLRGGTSLSWRRLILALALPAVVIALSLPSGLPHSWSGRIFFTTSLLAICCVWPATWKETLPWLVFVISGMLFILVRPYADEAGLNVHFAYPISIDRWLFGGILPSEWLQARLFEPGRVRPHDYLLVAAYVSYFLMQAWSLVAVWQARRQLFSRYLTAFILTFWLSIAGYVLLPTAPPWLAAQAGDVEGVAKVTRQVAQEVSPGRYDEAARLAGKNDVAAMPSLHFALPCLYALAAFRISRLAGLATGAYALVMGFALVYLGEHYVIDLLGGALVSLVAWKSGAYLVAGIRSLRARSAVEAD
jgi:membrane-associated phospholipid phosphatase